MASVWQSFRHDLQQGNDLALLCCRQQFLSDDNGLLFSRHWLKSRDLPLLGEEGIGQLDADPVFLQVLAEPMPVPGCSWVSLRQLLVRMDAASFQMLSCASQIATWLEQHRFCGACGKPMQVLREERAMYCRDCDLRHFPRVSPSMIVLVTRGEELLLARSPRFAAGFYSTLAGFVEPGESLEDCVIREVREEVGLQVGTLCYVGSQGWPFPHSLMLGFHAEYVAGEIVPQQDEIEDARWFTPASLPALPPRLSISRYLIDLHLARCSGTSEPVFPYQAQT
jgi:NAD+ diphosphatase